MNISLMDAYFIELLKAHPYTYEEVATVLVSGDLTVFEQDYEEDFHSLKQLFDTEQQAFQQAFAGDYRIKFVTLNGLKNILRMRFGFEATDYEAVETGLLKLEAGIETEQDIANMLSPNWKIKRNGPFISILL